MDTEKRETRIFFASVGTELNEMFEPYIQKMNFAAVVNPQHSCESFFMVQTKQHPLDNWLLFNWALENWTKVQ